MKSSIQQKAKEKKSEKSRRVWSNKEENALVISLRELIVEGWKCDNASFRPGYATELEKKMHNILPGTDLRANPHIDSKIKMWKRLYSSLVDMQSTSGFGWSDAESMIRVDSDDVWESYCKAHPDVKGMRFKSFPYFKEWEEIFGKDRANGASREDADDVVEEINMEVEAANDDSSGIQPEASLSSSRGSREKSKLDKKAEKKRKYSDEGSSEFRGVVDALADFTSKTENRLKMIAERIGHEHDVSAARKNVFEAIGELQILDMENQLKATAIIANKNQYLDIFFSLLDEAKVKMVQMILNGKM